MTTLCLEEVGLNRVGDLERESKSYGANQGRDDARQRVTIVASTRPRFIASVWLVMFFFLASACGPKRNEPVAENATFGYCPVCGMQVNAGDAWAA